MFMFTPQQCLVYAEYIVLVIFVLFQWEFSLAVRFILLFS